MTETVTTAIFKFGCVQAQRHEALVLENVSHALCQFGQQHHASKVEEVVKREWYSLLGAAMTPLGSEGLPDGDCRPLRRGAEHREHGEPFPLPFPEIKSIRLSCVMSRYSSTETVS